MGWAGLRGAVSPAAALALPQDFPERELLVWLTLCVIFATLVLQGLTLPLVIRTLGVREDDAAALEALRARKAAARAVLDRIEALRDEGWARDDSLDRLRGMYEFRHRRVARRAGALDGEEEHLDERSLVYQRTVRDLLETQRREIVRLRNEEQVSDEVLHALTREVDLEGQRLEI